MASAPLGRLLPSLAMLALQRSETGPIVAREARVPSMEETKIAVA
jgi:hypothetical protein